MSLPVYNKFGRVIPKQSTPAELEAHSKEIADRSTAQSRALESLRINYPDLFAIRIDPDSPGARYLKSTMGIDVTNEGVLQVLLRPYVEMFWNMRNGRYGAPEEYALLTGITKDCMEKLDLEYLSGHADNFRRAGLLDSNMSKLQAGKGHISIVDGLRAIVSSLNKLKTRTQKVLDKEAADKANANAKIAEEARILEAQRASAAKARLNAEIASREASLRAEERERQMAENKARKNAKKASQNARHANIRRRMNNRMLREKAIKELEFERVKEEERQKRGMPSAVVEGNLLGLHTAPEENLLKFPSVEENLKGLFGGSTRRYRNKKRTTRRHK